MHIGDGDKPGGKMSSLNQTIDYFKNYLNTRIASHSVYAANVANADTPFYKAKVPSFNVTLDRINKTDSETGKIFSSSNDPKMKFEMRIQNSPDKPREDGNNVKLEKEMSALAANTMMYMSAVKILSKQIAIARYAITSSAG